MSSDPIVVNAPILLQPNLDALDRRVGIILNIFRECIESKPVDDVIFSQNYFGIDSDASTQSF